MKSSIRYRIVNELLITTLILVFIEFFVQIALSVIFSCFDNAILAEGRVDVSELIWKKSGELYIYYTDIVRIGCFLLLIIPYVFCILKMINVQVVRPLKDIISEIQKIDCNRLEYRLDVPASYEFAEVKDAFNNLMNRLQMVDKQKNMLITGMAHDLKTPITTIRGYSQALAEGVIVEESQKKEYLLAIHRKSIQLNELISLLFDYSKLMTLEEATALEHIDLIELVKENIGLFYTDFEEKNIKFIFDIPDEKVFIQGETKQLNRVFANIYANALKYNKAGDTVYTEVTLEDGITIYIRDTGDKISEGLVEHIFEPFVMGDSARKAGGNGLGLSIAARIVKLHHGQIELEQKEENQYTKSFVIRFRV